MRLVALSAVVTAIIVGSAPAPASTGERTYTMIGTEPFWSLSVGAKTMTFDLAGQPKIVQKTPRSKKTRYGRVYWTKRIQVAIIANQPCSDGMSDYIYRDDVKVTVDGHEFIGCGGPRRLADYAKAN
jgi:heat shock protein HslJ